MLRWLAVRLGGNVCVSQHNNNHENRARHYRVFTPSGGQGTNAWRVARAKAAPRSMTLPCAILPRYYCVTGRGAVVGNAFVDVGIAVSGSGVPADVESGELLVEDGAVAESGGLFGGVGAVVAGVGWTVVSWFVNGALVVGPCWPHP
jgi:hypothetical protein